MGKVERRAQELLEVLPVRESNVIVGQDSFDGNAVKHPLKSSRKLLLSSVGEQFDEGSFAECIDAHEQHSFAPIRPVAVLCRADDEVELPVANLIAQDTPK